MNGNGQDWQAWLQDVVKSGLTARWDSEVLGKFAVARQVPAAQPVGVGGAGVQLPMPAAAPAISPLVMFGGAVVFAAALYYMLRD